MKDCLMNNETKEPGRKELTEIKSKAIIKGVLITPFNAWGMMKKQNLISVRKKDKPKLNLNKKRRRTYDCTLYSLKCNWSKYGYQVSIP